jgi:hypothetical protein
MGRHAMCPIQYIPQVLGSLQLLEARQKYIYGTSICCYGNRLVVPHLPLTLFEAALLP